MQSEERGYRTSDHAEQRKNEGKPVERAFADVQRAGRNDIFVQLDGRYVVRSSKDREHIFEPSGILVTSLNRSKRAHQAKLESGERQLVTIDEFQEFKEIFT